jgi:hypothetical protein
MPSPCRWYTKSQGLSARDMKLALYRAWKGIARTAADLGPRSGSDRSAGTCRWPCRAESFRASACHRHAIAAFPVRCLLAQERPHPGRSSLWQARSGFAPPWSAAGQCPLWGQLRKQRRPLTMSELLMLPRLSFTDSACSAFHLTSCWDMLRPGWAITHGQIHSRWCKYAPFLEVGPLNALWKPGRGVSCAYG